MHDNNVDDSDDDYDDDDDGDETRVSYYMMHPTLSENVLACNAATVLYKSMSSRGSMHTGKN